jgi:hypothetical protein
VVEPTGASRRRRRGPIAGEAGLRIAAARAIGYHPAMPAADHSESHPLASLAVLATMAGLLTAFGGSVWTAPLEILVVFFHEAAHALMTLATGGQVLEMAVTIDQGGHVLSVGGSRFLTLSAGYLGSLLIGAALLLTAAHSRHDRFVLAGLALLMALLTVLFMRNLFGLAYGIGMALAMLAIARFLPAIVSDYALRLIGVMSLLYVPRDIFSDTIARSHLPSDAQMLATEYGGGTWFWGGLWLLLSLWIAVWTVWATVRATARPPALSPAPSPRSSVPPS